MFTNGLVVWPHIAYPLVREWVPTWMSAIISFFGPSAVITVISIWRIGSFHDCNSAIMGLSYALSTATLFQAFLKLLFGGLRPHFLDVCQPRPSLGGHGYGNLFHTIDVCTGNNAVIRQAMMSFPSGHATAAFAGFTFLALWLNAKFKIFANYQSRCWHLVMFSAPLLVAMLISGSKVLDHFHHHHDIFVGAWIGKLFAVKAYRMRYKAVFDWRYNHTLLARPSFSMQHVPTRSGSIMEDKPSIGEGAGAAEDRRSTTGTDGRLERKDSGVWLGEEMEKIDPRLTAIDYAGWQNKYSEKRKRDRHEEQRTSA